VGFTNSYADTADIVIAESSTIDPSLYKNGLELLRMEERKEIIRVKGGDRSNPSPAGLSGGRSSAKATTPVRSCCTGV